jgi:streptogramin lyase
MMSSSVSERARKRIDLRRTKGESFVKSINGFCILLLVFGGVTTHAQLALTAQFIGAQVKSPIGTLANPYGLAVDTSGNIYAADNVHKSLSKLTPSGTLSTGLFSGDGNPYGVAVDGSGNLYITHNLKNEVVKETLQPDGSYTRSLLPVNGLENPLGIAVDAHGNLYIADSGRNRIVKAAPSGSTYSQSTVPTSTLAQPEGVAVDGSGNLYIADTLNLRVLKETPSGTGYTESELANLKYSGPEMPIDLAADAAGDVFILDYQNDAHFSVIEETLFGGVYTQSTLSSYEQNPSAIGADAGGDVYIVSPGTDRLVKLLGLTPDFGTVNIGSSSAVISIIFTVTTGFYPDFPTNVQESSPGDFQYLATGTCAEAPTSSEFPPGFSCTVDTVFTPRVSGSRNGAVALGDPNYSNVFGIAYVFGTGVGPQVSFPPGTKVSVAGNLVNASGVAVDGNGVVSYADGGTGVVSSGGAIVGYDLNHPAGLAVDGFGYVYAATQGGVWKMSALDGYPPHPIVDLPNLVGIAVDHSGNLYLTSSTLGNVHKETLQLDGSYTETAIGYGIATPLGVAVDGSGNIFMVNATDGRMYQETLQLNGSYLQSSFALAVSDPESLAIDGNGNLFVGDPDSGAIDKLTPQSNGSYAQAVTNYGLTGLTGLAVDGRENIFYTQASPSSTVSELDMADPPMLNFLPTWVGTTSLDSPKYVTILNAGKAALALPAPATGTNPSLVNGFTLEGETTCPVVGVSGAAGSLDAGGSCVYAISFTPTAPGSYTGTSLLTDTSLNAAGPVYSQQRIGLSGATKAADVTRTTMRITPGPIGLGRHVTITVTVADTTTPATMPPGQVTLTFTNSAGQLAGAGRVVVSLSSGEAIVTTIPDYPEVYTVTAYYGGVENSFLPSTGTGSFTVQP